jgi:hypothetical protein
VDADWSVELGADDSALEFPWTSPDGSHGCLDLLTHPEQTSKIPEATRYPELSEFLFALNAPSSPWLTAKCDVWFDDELGEAEDIYDARLKMCSYVDLIARDQADRFSFERHEQWVKSLARQLSDEDEQPITCEFVVRRCWYHAGSPADDEPAPGLYVTLYLFGYGDDEAQARSRWVEGLQRVTSVLIPFQT